MTLLLQHRLEVDQHVAAADQVDARERRVGEHVVAREHAHVADRLADPVAAVDLDEEAPQPLGGDVLRDGLRVDAGARLLDAGAVQVGGEDLHGNLSRQVLARPRRRRSRANRPPRRSSSPSTQMRTGSWRERSSMSLGNTFGFKHLERLRVAEEAGDADQDVLVQRLDLGRVVLAGSARSRAGSRSCAGPCAGDAPVERVALVVGEVDAGRAADAARGCARAPGVRRAVTRSSRSRRDGG